MNYIKNTLNPHLDIISNYENLILEEIVNLKKN